MFTGLVEVVGTVSALKGRSPLRLTIQSSLPTLKLLLGIRLPSTVVVSRLLKSLIILCVLRRPPKPSRIPPWAN